MGMEQAIKKYSNNSNVQQSWDYMQETVSQLGKVYFRSQILVHDYRSVVEHICFPEIIDFKSYWNTSERPIFVLWC